MKTLPTDSLKRDQKQPGEEILQGTPASDTRRPFSDFPLLAIRAEKALRRLIIVADHFADGCHSLSEVAKRTEMLTDCFTLSTIRKLSADAALVKLLQRSFDRAVSVYRHPDPRSGAITGLSDDGQLVVNMSRQFLADLDAQSC